MRVLQRAGFVIARQGKHIKMRKGAITVMVPRNNPVNAYTMGRIVIDAGLTVDEFMALL